MTFPTRVALVPHEHNLATDEEFRHDLMLVAAALQMQVTRDVGPIWGVSAIVSPFLSLEQVPRDFVPVAITTDAKLSRHRAGFHFTTDGTPAAFIKYCDGWPASASHELIEMLVDPTGTKTITGAALLKVADQGTVAYLMEVCDPCEEQTYPIMGVEVSDFVTPAFYGLADARPFGYSFTRNVTKQFGLLPGGYLTWMTQGLIPEESSVWQAFVPQGTDELEVKPLGTAPALLSRAWVDVTKEPHARRAALELAPRALRRRRTPTTAHSSLSFRMPWPLLTVPRKASRRFSRSSADSRLARDETFYKRFHEEPAEALKEVDIDPKTVDLSQLPPDHKPAQTAYQQLLTSTEQEHRVGYNFDEPNSVSWLGRLPI